jgi:hypothetical protein
MNTALTFGDSKESYLYFDSVVPLLLIIDAAVEYGPDMFSEHSPDIDMHRFMQIRERFDVLMHPDIRKGGRYFDDWVDLASDVTKCLMSAEAEKTKPVNELIRTEVLPQMSRRFCGFVAKAFPDHAIYTSSATLVSEGVSPIGTLAVAASNLELIDVSNIALEKLIEFRNDKSSKSKLRRLRLFACENYSGKPVSFIEDDLMSRLDDYKDVARKWDFETTTSCLTTLLSSKVLLGTVGAALVTTVAGLPLASLGAAALGLSIELGNVSLSIAKTRFAAQEALASHPMSYLEAARRVGGSTV